MNLAAVEVHYDARNWGTDYRKVRWPLGPVDDLGPEFRVLEFPARPEREWTYATLGMSGQPEAGEEWGLELHLISLPYLDGPRLEWLNEVEPPVRFLWLLPITASERHFVREHGIDALEEQFEAAQFNYLDPHRASVVG